MSEADGDAFDWMGLIADRKIVEAMEEGLFKNLPGAGKPLYLSINPFEPPGMRAVNRVLSNNRVLPPWLVLENEIEASRAETLAVLERWEASAEGVRQKVDFARRRSEARCGYERLMQSTNELVRKYNSSKPFVHRSSIGFMTKHRLAEFDERYGVDESE